jgi:hypothetical protein
MTRENEVASTLNVKDESSSKETITRDALPQPSVSHGQEATRGGYTHCVAPVQRPSARLERCLPRFLLFLLHFGLASWTPFFVLP